jgi:putative transposase
MHDENRLHLVVYHLVWTPKRRKPVLTQATLLPIAIPSSRRNATREAGTSMELAVSPDHVSLLVHVWPTTSAAEVVKECKGVTSHTLCNKYPDLSRIHCSGPDHTSLPP